MYADKIAQILHTVFAFGIVLSVHEAAHAGMAYLLGDNTAKRMGRLTLNPLVHVDPLGLLCLLVFRIGWAKPVMFDHRNFARPKLYSVLTAYAGPASNFVLALLSMVCLKFLPVNYLWPAVAMTFANLFKIIAWVSIMLGIFNLLPIPPLDGSHILTVMLVDRRPDILALLHRYSFFVLIGLFVLFPNATNGLLFLMDKVYNFLGSLVF